MRSRRSGNIKPKATRVRRRNADERAQGGTVRILTAEDLPTGCSHLRSGDVPCTFRMSHIDVKVERRFRPEEESLESVIKLIGYCKAHRPRTERVILLPADLDRLVNGPKSQRSRIKRMEVAMFIYVVPQGGVIKHSALRSSLPGEWYLSGDLVSSLSTLCGKRLKKSYVPTLAEARDDHPKTCQKCDEAREVAKDEASEKDEG